MINNALNIRRKKMKKKRKNKKRPKNNKSKNRVKHTLNPKIQRISKLPTNRGFLFPRTIKKFIPALESRYKLEIPYTDYSNKENKLMEFNDRKTYKVIARIAKLILSPNEDMLTSRCHLVKLNDGYSIQSKKFNCCINQRGELQFLIYRNNSNLIITDEELNILYRLFNNIHQWCIVNVKNSMIDHKYIDVYKEMYSDFYELSWFLQIYIMNKQLNSTYQRINNLEIKGCLYKHIKDNVLYMNKNLLSPIIIEGIQKLYDIPYCEYNYISDIDKIDLEHEINIYIKKIWECLQECILKY